MVKFQECGPGHFPMIDGRGERIRTSDLSVPNHRFGNNVSFCLC